MGGLAGALCLAGVALAGAAMADDDPSFLAFSAGAYDVSKDRTAGEFRVEYRGRKLFGPVKPLLGVMTTSDSALYGYFGLGVDIFFGPRIVLLPSASAGLYDDGHGKPLGHVVEFRTGAELAYRFDDRSRIGIAIHHISNASLGNKNPGEESVVITYAVPLEKIIGR
ncbi:MAG: acyloxyacyl hydrolase [Alphaproteobacteria bacterium]|nr:acyloxyacyl hydrolase [Alphaproteobacteria bacterium]